MFRLAVSKPMWRPPHGHGVTVLLRHAAVAVPADGVLYLDDLRPEVPEQRARPRPRNPDAGIDYAYPAEYSFAERWHCHELSPFPP
ncbi:MAG: hypothetical protein ABID87_06390 [Chloroflexota bacterium]